MKKVELASGQFLELNYHEGRLSSIRDILGREIGYGFEGDLLSRVNYPHGGTITYSYTAEGYIRSITNPNGETYVTNYYGQKGRVVR